MSASPTTPSTTAPRLIRHPVLQLDGFLMASEVAWLSETVFAREADFRPSAVADRKEDYRRSLVLEPPPAIQAMMLEKIRAVIPEAIRAVRVPPFEPGLIECQVTANNDGSYFRVHTDATKHEAGGRVFTYVYYFNRPPRRFFGGDLRVYDDQIREGRFARVDSHRVIEPLHNRIVFFNAAVMHEVTPVEVPSRAFVDSRFTVNGWVHRA